MSAEQTPQKDTLKIYLAGSFQEAKFSQVSKTWVDVV